MVIGTSSSRRAESDEAEVGKAGGAAGRGRGRAGWLRAALAAVLGILLAGSAACGGGRGVVPLEVVPLNIAKSPNVSLRVVPPPALQDQSLPDDAFVVRQAGEVRPAEVDPIEPAAVEVALVVDLVGEQDAGAPPPGDLRRAAASFLLALPAGVRFTVVDAGAPPPSAHMTGDIATAIGRVDAMEAPVRGDLESAIEAALAGFTPATGSSRDVVILTTGHAEVDERLVDGLTGALRRAGVVAHLLGVWTLTTLTTLSPLATATGGSVRLGNDAWDVSHAARATVASIVNGYRVDFVAAETGATDVEVELRHSDITARADLRLDLPAPATPNGTSAPGRDEQPASGRDRRGPLAVLASTMALAVVGVLVARPVVRHRRGTPKSAWARLAARPRTHAVDAP
jgi:hypothetical protein